MVGGWWRWWRRVELVGTPGAYRLRLRVSRSEDQGRRMLENGKGLGLEWKRELGAAVRADGDKEMRSDEVVSTVG